MIQSYGLEIFSCFEDSKIYLDWNGFERLASSFCQWIESLNFDKDNVRIVGLTFGALPLLTVIKNRCGIRHAGILWMNKDKMIGSVNSDKKCENIIVIDDIFDTGKTFYRVKKSLNLPYAKRILYAVLIYRCRDNYEFMAMNNLNIDFYACGIDDKRWVVFPWEEVV